MTHIPIKHITNDLVKLSNPIKRIDVLFRIVVSLCKKSSSLIDAKTT